ncbi:CD63 antigen-like [Belonocnema kinseyi]|uniref:CD63 antigen-like n=1 Tax=Belonocnema kinseyi TaxID=2817044 RepID=UPI00143CF050|nr:CD63 antigen-like [Belonocnema kinseyi]XP_033216146.1 CD63 antigen-like [Belonocnema kinseyi]XP_033216147.1 CD63 antigen-like [Belonocnema kinseyi]XP_033216148.1 CD63 antigen-like [Belonocnema kinseyi]XP_033216150.1 CD63 antigen-like [Belonocnema kinseyi]XP_033216151.1 CD63 antigen-like [Belonocnema kinseyi]
MTHRDKCAENDEETESSSDEEMTESVSSGPVRKPKFFGIPIYKLSYRRLPKKCLKVSFLAINSASLLTGIIIVVLSIWMLIDIKLLIGQGLFISILLLLGIFSTSMSFIGLFAFVKKRTSLLLLYIACQSILLCTIFICAIMSFSLFDKVMQKIRGDMRKSIENYHNLDWATEAWDNTHRYLKCCGIKSYKDWIDYRKNIPQSCCSTAIEKCAIMSEEVAYKSGCLKSAVILLKSHIYAVCLSVLLISITIATSVFVAFGVRRKLKAN